MKLAYLTLAVSLTAAEFPRIVLSPRQGVVLGNPSTRPLHSGYRVEFLPSTPPTNLVTIVTTNELLRVEDLAQVPSGPGVMGVTAIYADGEQSETAVLRYYLRRASPPAPSVTPAALSTTNAVEKSLTNELWKIRSRRVVPVPPIPQGFFGPTVAQNATVAFRPLTNATNWSYSQHRDWLADRAAKGKRRSE